MAEVVSLYARLVRARVRSQLQYRTSFALDLVAMAGITFLDFVAVLVIFRNVPTLDGWSIGEVAFLYATSAMAFALTDMAIGHLDGLSQLVREGSFDLLLIRPRSTLFQVMTMDFQLKRLGKALQGLAVLVYALTLLDLAWTPGKIAMLVTMILAGAVIFGAVWIFVICIVFWSVEGRETANAFTYGGNYLAQFPITIYDAWLRRFLAYVVPMAFVSYMPALFILGKEDPLGLPGWLRFASPAVAVLTVLGAGAMWRHAMRHYRSAGG